MKIKTKSMAFDKVLALPTPARRPPMKQWAFLRGLIRVASIPAYIKARFTFAEKNMELVKDKPCLILMNHSCFLDLKMAFAIFKRPFSIVATTDSFVGIGWIMRLLGCIPTQKFVSDMTLLSDMKYALEHNKSSVLMFPEAGYSFDGCAAALPPRFGMLLKQLGVPVVTVITEGAFLRQPLYNELKKRKTKVSAKVECILSSEDIKAKTISELDEIIDKAFGFDSFKTQYETKTEINEPFRAKGLERILYRCPECNAEGCMSGNGTQIVCRNCGKGYEMDVLGRLNSANGETEFQHIPDWYSWQRECVRHELENGKYRLDAEVDIAVLKDYKALYTVGSGRLIHDENGFLLTGCEGKLEYCQSPLASHSLNADFYWYQIGDVIGIGNKDMIYYCFPKGNIPVTKIRLAAEELYKLQRAKRRRPKEIQTV